MKYFIEITDKNNGLKICLPIPRIKSVSVDLDGNTFVETDVDSDGQPVGIVCNEPYSQIMLKLLRFVL